MFNRREMVWAGTELVETIYRDVDWEEVRQERNRVLEISDLWMLTDRYAQLSEEQQTELVAYRQLLRDVMSDYETSNEAADHFPVAPTWFN